MGYVYLPYGGPFLFVPMGTACCPVCTWICDQTNRANVFSSLTHHRFLYVLPTPVSAAGIAAEELQFYYCIVPRESLSLHVFHFAFFSSRLFSNHSVGLGCGHRHLGSLILSLALTVSPTRIPRAYLPTSHPLLFIILRTQIERRSDAKPEVNCRYI